MASVRMTNDLRDTIYNKAMEAFNSARPEPKPTTELTNLVRDAILSSEPYKALKDQFDRQHSYSFNSFGGPTKGLSREDCARLYLSSKTGFHLNTTEQLVFEFVPAFSIYRTNSWNMPEFNFDELGPQAQSQLLNGCKQAALDKHQYSIERADYSTKIRSLLKQCSTVKQLLLAWPAGESFVPHEAKTRMYERITRVARAQQIKEEVQFDDAFVNEVVLTAKLIGG